MKKQLWIGLFGLKVLDGNRILENYKYAYVNALCMAEDSQEFISKVSNSCAELKFLVDEIEDVEPFQRRILNFNVNERMFEQAKMNDEVMYDTFHGVKNTDIELN